MPLTRTAGRVEVLPLLVVDFQAKFICCTGSGSVLSLLDTGLSAVEVPSMPPVLHHHTRKKEYLDVDDVLPMVKESSAAGQQHTALSPALQQQHSIAGLTEKDQAFLGQTPWENRSYRMSKLIQSSFGLPAPLAWSLSTMGVLWGSGCSCSSSLLFPHPDTCPNHSEY